MEQNQNKLYLGIIEVIYFGFFCFEPRIWPNIQPPETCDIPFTIITAVYAGMILFIMIPLRIFLNSKKEASPERNNWIYAIITVLHMALCLGWLIYALCELKGSDASCWNPFTWQYMNYYILLIITLGPAMTLGLGLVLLICCLPCICGQIIEIVRDGNAR